MKSNQNLVCLTFVFLVLNILSACSCSSPPQTSKKGTPVGAGGGLFGGIVGYKIADAIGVRAHNYSPIINLGNEPSGYGMYTYVLFGNKVGMNGPALPTAVMQRYQSLLEAIESSTGRADYSEDEKVFKNQINLFCIPSKSFYWRLTVDNYNSDLAFKYCNLAIRGIISNENFLKKLSNAPGPFLISSLHPLNQIRKPEPILMADLSEHNPKAMREIIATYKERLNTTVSEKDKIFESFRLKLLTLVLDANENVTVVKYAIADWLPAQ